MTPQSQLELLKRPEHFFRGDLSGPFQSLFDSVEYVWDGLDRLQTVLQSAIEKSDATKLTLPDCFQMKTIDNREGYTEKVIYVTETFQANTGLVIPDAQMMIGKGTVFEPSALIKPPLIVGSYSEIRQAAYIRGGALIGDHCTVGHATEVKTAVFMDHTEAGHFAYVGDSLLGRCVNLGAGTKLANLPFRTLKQKEEQRFDPFDVNVDGRRMHTGKAKLGAILGDGVETGCNSTIAPGTVIDCDSWVYPCIFVKGGFYPRGSIVKTSAQIQQFPRR